MMAAPAWSLVKAFIREATEDESFAPVASIDDAYAKLRTLQRGHFQTVTEDGTTLISSNVAGKTFAWQVSAELSPADIIATAESALELIAGKTVAQARALLVRRKTTRATFHMLGPNL
jgi:hypothetical protein